MAESQLTPDGAGVRARTPEEENWLWKAAFQSMSEPVILVDRNRVITDVNSALCALLGLIRTDLVGQSTEAWSRRIHLRTPDGLAVTRQESVSEGAFLSGQVHAAERLIRRSNGEERRVRLTSAPLVDPMGQIEGVVTVIHDVTEFYNLEGARERFIAMAAHELRNPLSAAVGAVEMMTYLRGRGRLSEERLDRYLPVLNNQLARLSIRVENLYETSRLNSNRLQLNLEWLDLVDLVRNSLNTFQSGPRGNPIISHLPERPILGHFDRTRMAQAVGNLLDYALRYSPEDVPIDVSLTYQRAGEGDAEAKALIQVRDQGMGIASQDLPHLFERFYRADKLGSGQRGAGLGLYLVRAIAQAHGGNVWADSAGLDQGLTIHAQLPCAVRER